MFAKQSVFVKLLEFQWERCKLLSLLIEFQFLAKLQNDHYMNSLAGVFNNNCRNVGDPLTVYNHNFPKTLYNKCILRNLNVE